MPCEDISAVVTIVLDKDERLRYYLFEKITCGKIIPLSNRLQEHCRGMTLDDLEGLRLEDVVRTLGVPDEDMFFVMDKELDAVQSAVANYRGSNPALDLDRYKIESILYSADSITIKQVILEAKPDVRIPSCRTIARSS